MWHAVLLILVLVLVWHFAAREGFQSCRCEKPAWISPEGNIIINPYLYPSSGVDCVDKLYPSKDVIAPLTHLNTPDHEILTN